VNDAAAQVFAAAEKTANDADQVTRRLIKILDDKSARAPDRSHAIRCLDRFHSVIVITPLLSNLLLIDPDVTEPGPLASFPAASAVAHYGRPLYGELMGVTLRECSDDYLHVLAFVLQSMDGEEVALLRLKERLDDPQTTPMQAKNLKQLAALLRELDFTDAKDRPIPSKIRDNLEKSQSK